MALIKDECYELIDFTCPRCNYYYAAVKVAKLCSHSWGQHPVDKLIHANKCCGLYYTKDRELVLNHK